VRLASFLFTFLLAVGLPARSADAAIVAAPLASVRSDGACGSSGQPTTTVFLPNITKTLGGPAGWVTPFIVQNVGVNKATLEVSFYRFSDGGLVVCRKVSDLAPATSFADFPNADVDLPADSQFSVVVRSFGSEVVSVVNEHQGIGVPGRSEALSYDGLVSGATSVYLPFVAKPQTVPCAAGAAPISCDRSWVTTMIMQNFGASDAIVTTRFLPYDGGAQITLTRTVAPARSRFIDPTVEPTLPAGRYYAAVMTSTQPIGVIANDHDDAPSTIAPRAFSYNGVPQATAGEVFVPYVRRDAPGSPVDLPNGVVVQNMGTVDATPTLSLQRLGGGLPVSITAPAPVKPGTSWYFDPGTSALAAGEHSLIVTGGAFAVVAATLAPGSAMGYVGVAAQGNRSYLPNVTRTLGGVNGWSTPILIQSSGATSVTLRWYRFSDGALVARQPVGLLTRGAAVRVDPRSVPALTDDTQYGVVVDAQGGNIAAIVTELDFEGGDGTMAYEGFPATVSPIPVPTAVTITPGAASLGTDEALQLTATVKDQFDQAMPQIVPGWSVSSVALGSITSAGLFTAGPNAAVGTIGAAAGAVNDSIAVTVIAPTPVAVAGISFLLRTTGSADLYTETTITLTDAASISTEVNADVARIQQDYGRPYQTRPQVYVMGADASYVQAQSAILGIPSTFLGSPGERFETAGVYYSLKVAIDWARISSQRPVTTARHELTHMMIDEISGGAAVPAWLNEGSARLEEFSVPGSTWLATLDRSRAVSMATTNQLLSLDDMTSQLTWNGRSGLASSYQYSEAEETVGQLRNEIGIAGEVSLLSLLAQGQTFDSAYAAITGRTTATFAASMPARLSALAAAPGIAIAPDSTAGTGLNGPTFVVYGFAPNTLVTLTITGAFTGSTNRGRFQFLDQYGVYWSWLGPEWPADRYTFTATTSSGVSVTATFTKTP
jgi:hypothetical protein